MIGVGLEILETVRKVHVAEYEAFCRPRTLSNSYIPSWDEYFFARAFAYEFEHPKPYPFWKRGLARCIYCLIDRLENLQ